MQQMRKNLTFQQPLHFCAKIYHAKSRRERCPRGQGGGQPKVDRSGQGGGGGVKITKNVRTSFMDDPKKCLTCVHKQMAKAAFNIEKALSLLLLFFGITDSTFSFLRITTKIFFFKWFVFFLVPGVKLEQPSYITCVSLHV